MLSDRESSLQMATKPNQTEVSGFKIKDKGVYQQERKWGNFCMSMNAESLLFFTRDG